MKPAAVFLTVPRLPPLTLPSRLRWPGIGQLRGCRCSPALAAQDDVVEGGARVDGPLVDDGDGDIAVIAVDGDARTDRDDRVAVGAVEQVVAVVAAEVDGAGAGHPLGGDVEINVAAVLPVP